MQCTYLHVQYISQICTCKECLARQLVLGRYIHFCTYIFVSWEVVHVLFTVLLYYCVGKTIQTIALLAHLVCERGIWGPHLIIVPTSVLLNWEYELKKWCPALKILTYFGSLKERKQKRIVS